MSAHYVYRAFEENGTLLYVGETNNLVSRLKNHHHSTWWFPLTSKVVAKVYQDKALAVALETAAIKQESPRFNVKGRYSDTSKWTRQNFLDYYLAATNLPGHLTPARVKHLHNVSRRYKTTFGEDLPATVPYPPRDGERRRRGNFTADKFVDGSWLIYLDGDPSLYAPSASPDIEWISHWDVIEEAS
ncbi:GIY-YIG nuclease family protein [Mycolicibacterium gilvum]|uniref:GIY-YIG nuclease family protein n=1 Tax=Mycolicibacterium gilvum TaxID=1804 RepID=UPI0040453D3F